MTAVPSAKNEDDGDDIKFSVLFSALRDWQCGLLGRGDFRTLVLSAFPRRHLHLRVLNAALAFTDAIRKRSTATCFVCHKATSAGVAHTPNCALDIYEKVLDALPRMEFPSTATEGEKL